MPTVQNDCTHIGMKNIVILLLLGSWLSISCTSGTRMLNKVPVNSVDIRVTDTDGEPVKGAAVESSNGRSTATDSSGVANVRFGSVGVFTVTAAADDFAPANIVVTMPVDRGETIEMQLAPAVDYSGWTAGIQNIAAQNMQSIIAAYLFNSYGYPLELEDYEEGEWTEWRLTETEETEDPIMLRKAFLKREENGQEWWQVVVGSEDEPDYIAELLFDENRESIRRIREQFEDGEPEERPVREGLITERVEYTEESMEAAKDETGVTVEVPSGEFEADRYRFASAPDVSLLMWKNNDIPGAVIRYEHRVEDGDESVSAGFKSELTDYGSNAESLLNTF